MFIVQCSQWWLPMPTVWRHLQPSSLRRCNPLLNRFTWKLLPPKLDLHLFSKSREGVCILLYLNSVTCSSNVLINFIRVVGIRLQVYVSLNLMSRFGIPKSLDRFSNTMFFLITNMVFKTHFINPWGQSAQIVKFMLP